MTFYKLYGVNTILRPQLLYITNCNDNIRYKTKQTKSNLSMNLNT